MVRFGKSAADALCVLQQRSGVSSGAAVMEHSGAQAHSGTRSNSTLCCAVSRGDRPGSDTPTTLIPCQAECRLPAY